MTITVIKNADIVVAWDAEASRHVYLHGADVAFEGGTLRYVGPRYEGKADETIDGSGRMVMPGLVNIHSHPSSEALNKGFLDELGSPALYNSSLYEYMPILRPDAEAVPDCVQVAYSELLLSGVTTVADMSVAHPGWIDLAANSGLRVCLSPMYRSARWYTKNGYIVEYEWDEKAGVAAMENAFAVIEQAQKHESGRLFAMVSPSQIDTCSEGLIKDSYAEARRRGLPWQIHAAQSTVEFHEITRRHGVSPIQWLEKLGVLGDTSIVGHGIFLDDYPRVAWHTRRDLALLAETGTTVAHCPTVFLRRGIALDDFGRYRRAGVRIGLGTDTYPHNMLEEMRHVGYVARLMAETPHTLKTTDIFEAATTAGAAALGRSDIGKLEAGCKADIVMVDLAHPMMQPRRDPVRSLVYAAAERAVDRVYVDGRLCVQDGTVLTMDYPAAALRLTEAQKRTEAAAPANDWAKRPVTDYSPLTFPVK
ncbi:amidohydrolase family protein [Bosea sp. BH3]|uniref:amidohydrolase family protein n=1 Tax=Bosea sp. BH3 TaxID=2871701 RepID=UPI0021CAEF1C|nr:amidohydrolase family protein [Bosea sp. BH3]MCU4181380.1 amidohydrolase family protein [Bosea sp. BH3]